MIYSYATSLKYHFLLNEAFGDTLEQISGSFSPVDFNTHAYASYPVLPVLCEGDEKYSSTGYCQGKFCYNDC